MRRQSCQMGRHRGRLPEFWWMALELLRRPIRRVFFSQVTPLLAEEQVPPYRSRDAFEAVEVELSVARVIDLAFSVVVA